MNLRALHDGFHIDVIHWFKPIKTIILTTAGGAAVSGSSAMVFSDLPASLWLGLICLSLVGFIAVVAVLRTVIYFEFTAHKAEEEALVGRVEMTGRSFDGVADQVAKWRKDLNDKLVEHTKDIESLRSDHDALKREVKALQQHPILRRTAVGKREGEHE